MIHPGLGISLTPETARAAREYDDTDLLLLLRGTPGAVPEAPPRHVDLQEVRPHTLEMSGVVNVHRPEAWAITSGMNDVSAPVVVDDAAQSADVLDRLGTCLSGGFDIEHST